MGIMNNTGGKGSGRRPLSVSQEEFNRNFDKIFGKKEKPKEDHQCKNCENCQCKKDDHGHQSV